MYLKKINSLLAERIESGTVNFSIPREWFPPRYEGTVKLSGKWIFVNPYEFGSSICSFILSRGKEGVNYLQPLSRINKETTPDWIQKANIYGAFIRSTSAYGHLHPDHYDPMDAEGYTESGTILKMLFMLPYLSAMGFDAIYFLPVTKYSDLFKKGEIGSPYSVKNVFEIDPRYHDTLLDGMKTDEEFKAFIEAAHILGIRIILDFIPRTAARDSELILDHPEWFYWIDVAELENYFPPKIPELGFEIPSNQNLEIIYANPDVQKHLKKFKLAPNITNPEKWDNFVAANKNNPEFLNELAKTFGVITPPGFSDWVNDTQPTWDDITFLRFYHDHPAEAAKYLKNPASQPPYILYDVIKASLFPGNEPITELWKTIEGIMPYFNKKFGVDAARLDMGHALPVELEKSIIQKAHKTDPAFAVIAEELVMENDEKSKKSGYSGILGNTWWMESRIEEGKLKELCYKVLPNLKISTLGAAETPDTPRAATRKGEKLFSKFATTLNYFLPNAIPFVNSGQEIFEIQPMNLGLDNSEEGRFVLPRDDRFYGKLAFFDHYVLHWNSNDNMIKLISSLSKVRSENLDLIPPDYLRLLFENETRLIGYLYWNSKKGLLLIANADLYNSKEVFIDLGYYTWKEKHDVRWRIRNYREDNSLWKTSGTLNFTASPGEIMIATIE
ncbi:MAG: maltodextrin glycosyltransferase [Thermotogae bacterium]|nr:MAG: maltodextrin glycosyltransferase [Thermotogota bacterium]